MEATKINESSFEITKEAPVIEPTKVVYDINALKEQEISILKSMNEFVAQRQVELDEVRGLIAKAEELGLKTREELQAESVIIEEEKLETAQEEIIN